MGGTHHGIMYEGVNVGMHLVEERVGSSSTCSIARSLRRICLVERKDLSGECLLGMRNTSAFQVLSSRKV